MAHYAASSLIYLKKVRPSISRGRHLPNTSEPEAGIVPTEAATRSNVLRWCRLLFIIPVIAMLISKFGKKEGAHTAQIFLGIFVAVVLMLMLVCLPLAIFNWKNPRRADCYNSDDEQETDGAVPDQQVVSSSCYQESTSNSDQHYSVDRAVTDSISCPMYVTRDLHYLSDESRSSSSESLEGSRRTYPVDDPPPYYRVVINFPMAEVHHSVIREPPSETPPPSYDEVFRQGL